MYTYTYIYIYIHICIYMYVYTYVCIYVYVSVYVDVNRYTDHQTNTKILIQICLTSDTAVMKVISCHESNLLYYAVGSHRTKSHMLQR